MLGSHVQGVECKECGARVSGDAQTCGNCGAVKSAIMGSIPPAGLSELAGPGNPNEPQNGLMEHVLSYLGAVVGGNIASKVLVIAILYFAITPASDSDSVAVWTVLALSVAGVVTAGIYIGVYSITKGRLVNGAFPVIAGIGAFGVVISISLSNQSDDASGATIAGIILNYLIAMGGFGYFFRSRIFLQNRNVTPARQFLIQSKTGGWQLAGIIATVLAFSLAAVFLVQMIYGPKKASQSGWYSGWNSDCTSESGDWK
tara:strand:- start:5668 stop:6441 length:774 start_codon:yes stop_codon:yes gene_type:complete